MEKQLGTRRRVRGRLRNNRRPVHGLSDKPFKRLINPFRPLEALSAEQLEQIHAASMHILENIGIEFLDEEVLDIWERAGAKVDRSKRHVWLDRGLILESISHAPGSFELYAREPGHTLTLGGAHINFATVGAAPFFSDFDGGRRPGTLEAFNTMVKLTQMCGPIHMVEGLMVEPQDIPVPIRHLEKGYSQFTLSDKTHTTAAHGRVVAQDYVNMAAILFGGLETIQQRPVFVSNVNANSPLRYDERMLGALLVYARNGQPNVITPFVLAGAMSPVTMSASLAQSNAEALAGVALTQLINRGVPVMYGSFTTNIDMQTGGPAFGSPEGALAMLSGAQLARYYDLPYRGSGGLNNAKLPDAQAAYETQMSLWPAVLAHANLILHSAGWLEAGLVCSLEKFILDVEGLAMMHHFLAGLDVDSESLALESIAEVGPGGHHFGTAHTMARYREAFYLPIVSDRQSFDQWRENGGLDAAQRANQTAKAILATYVQPALDPGIHEELEDYVARRKEELLGSF